MKNDIKKAIIIEVNLSDLITGDESVYIKEAARDIQKAIDCLNPAQVVALFRAIMAERPSSKLGL